MKKIAVAAVFAFLACTPSGGFSIIPSAAAAVPDQVLQFALSQAASGVVWTANAGTITQTGQFTAPGCTAPLPQSITVTATAGAFSATATVAVADAVTGIAVNPSSISLAPGGSTTFVATVKTLCNPAGTVAGAAATRFAPAKR